MIRFRVNEKNKREALQFEKLRIIAERRHTSVDLLCRCILLDFDADSELSFWHDKSDVDLQREMKIRLSRYK